MQQDLCDILAMAYRSPNGPITHNQVESLQSKVRRSTKNPKFLSALRLLTKYQYLKTTAPTICILTAQGLEYVEQNDLVDPEVIRRDRMLRAILLGSAKVVKDVADEDAADEDAEVTIPAETIPAEVAAAWPAWKVNLLDLGYTHESIEGRYQYLQASNAL